LNRQSHYWADKTEEDERRQEIFAGVAKFFNDRLVHFQKGVSQQS
jgi:hypothetical protein